MLALKIIGGLLAFFGMLGVAAGFLFRISHWPGANLCFLGGGVLFVAGVALVIVGFANK